MMELATNMKHLRRSRGWSQDDLAAKLGVSRGKIASYELRNVQPRLPLLSKMAVLFDVTVDELLRRSELGVGGQDGHVKKIREVQSNPDVTLLKERLRHQSTKIKQLYEIIRLKDELLAAKQGLLDAVRQNGSLAITPTSTDLHFAADENGELMNWQTVEIPSDRYVDLAPGISDRMMTAPDNLVYSWEEIFTPIALQLDFSKQKVILNRSAKNASFIRHYHPEKETLYCVQGKFRELLSNRVIKAGELIAFEPFQAHEIHFLEDTLIIISLDF